MDRVVDELRYRECTPTFYPPHTPGQAVPVEPCAACGRPIRDVVRDMVYRDCTAVCSFACAWELIDRELALLEQSW